MNRKIFWLTALGALMAVILTGCGGGAIDVSDSSSGQEDVAIVSDTVSPDGSRSRNENAGTENGAENGSEALQDVTGDRGKKRSETTGDISGAGEAGREDKAEEKGTGTGGVPDENGEDGRQNNKENNEDNSAESSGSETDGTAGGEAHGTGEAQAGAGEEIPDWEDMTEEEWLEYLEQYLPTASRKPDYIQPIIDALDMLPREKPDSTLRQRDVDCDALQWFNGTYAMFLESSGSDYHFVGGYDDQSSSSVDYIRSQLESSWGITDRASAIDTLYWLALSGHAADYAKEIQLMALYGFLDLSEEELRKAVLDRVNGESLTEESAIKVVEYFLRQKAVYEACGENGMDAWDYCRFMQIAGNTYYAGYLTLEESLSVQLECARAIQQQFASWDEMNQSYLQGYIFWVDNSTATYIRERAYERLQNAEDSPFNRLDFKMPLEKFW